MPCYRLPNNIKGFRHLPQHAGETQARGPGRAAPPRTALATATGWDTGVIAATLEVEWLVQPHR